MKQSRSSAMETTSMKFDKSKSQYSGDGRIDSTSDVKKPGNFRKKYVASAYASFPPSGSAPGRSRISYKTGTNGDTRNDQSTTFRTGFSSQRRGYSTDQHASPLTYFDKNSSNAKGLVGVTHTTSGRDPIHPMQDMGTTIVSPVSENSQVTSESGLSALLENIAGITVSSSSSVSLSPDEIVLAEQYFPVTFGATSYSASCDLLGLLSISGVWPLRTISSSTKKTSKSGNHRHGKRPGSGQSSSSSNSKSSVERIYLMATDSPRNGVGFSTPLSSTPYQTQVARLRAEQLRIEEERLQHLRIMEKDERRRGTTDRWCKARTTPLQYESHRYSTPALIQAESNSKTPKH